MDWKKEGWMNGMMGGGSRLEEGRVYVWIDGRRTRLEEGRVDEWCDV